MFTEWSLTGQIGMFVDSRDARGSQAAERSVELVGGRGRNWDPSGGDHSGSCHNCSYDKKGGSTWVSQDQRRDAVCHAVSLQSEQALVKSRNRNCGWLGSKLAVNYWKGNSSPGRCSEACWEVIRICRVWNMNFFFLLNVGLSQSKSPEAYRQNWKSLPSAEKNIIAMRSV